MSISTKQFNYIKKDKKFVTEISLLGDSPFFRIFPDSCDLGCSIRSEKTGQIAQFYIYRTHYNPNEPEEVTHWDLKPTPESIRKMPGLKDVTMIIFND